MQHETPWVSTFRGAAVVATAAGTLSRGGLLVSSQHSAAAAVAAPTIGGVRQRVAQQQNIVRMHVQQLYQRMSKQVSVVSGPSQAVILMSDVRTAHHNSAGNAPRAASAPSAGKSPGAFWIYLRLVASNYVGSLLLMLLLLR